MTSITPTTAPAAATEPDATTSSTTRLPEDLHAIAQNVLGELAGIFADMEWAEEEIAAAQKRHPHAVDELFHSFRLLAPRFERMGTEFVYRSHCRELLARVVSGADTRPGTAAEVCCVMLETSLRAPLRSSAAGLYMRMWEVAGFPEIEEFTAARSHHEALESTVIDGHEEFVRGSLAVPDRRLTGPSCQGLHHSKPVTCRFAKPEQLTLA